MKNKVIELRNLFATLQDFVQQPESEASWRFKYLQVFSDGGSKRVKALFDDLNIEFSYYDPDLDYEDDVRAFMRALEHRMEEVQPMLDAQVESDRSNTSDEATSRWIAMHFTAPDTPRMAVASSEEAAIAAIRKDFLRKITRDEIFTAEFTSGQAFKFSDQ